MRSVTHVEQDAPDSDSRRVDDEPIPLAFDVIIRRLLGDIQTVKFQLPGDLFLSLEDYQRNLTANQKESAITKMSSWSWTAGMMVIWLKLHLQTVVADHAEERDDCVENRQEAQRR